MVKQTLVIDGQALSLDDYRAYLSQRPVVTVAPEVMQRLESVRFYIEDKIAQGAVIYGVNTGFGHLASEHIPNDQLKELQLNLVRSHAAGVGDPVEDDIVRIMLLVKLQSLAQGFSGVRPAVLEQIAFFINNDILPIIPQKGSVGASGDLAPLAHLTLALIGEGDVIYLGRRQTAASVLDRLNRDILHLEAKEGLAILNGTQSMVSHGIAALLRSETLLKSAELIIAASVDAIKGSADPFHPAIQQAKGSSFNAGTARRIATYLSDSDINHSHQHCGKVQDPYSFRCAPQVMGAIWEAYDHVKNILVRESNSVSDNPLIFPDEDRVLSGGNFHGESPALVMDYLAMAVSEIGAISERRIALMTDKHMSGLPAFLVKNSGVNSGFMIAHVTAAALASENKGLAHPSSVDSLPTSANQEDHVSMGHRSGRKLLEILFNTENILAIELITAMQGIDMHRPLKSSPVVEKVFSAFRNEVKFWEYDREMYKDIDAARRFITGGKITVILYGKN